MHIIQYRAQKRMTGEDVYGSKIQVVLQGSGQQVPDKALQRRASLQKQGCLEVQPTAPVPRPFQGSVLPTGGGQRLPLQNKCDQFVVKLLIKVQADPDLRGNADVLRKWLNSVFHEAHVKASVYDVRAYTSFGVVTKCRVDYGLECSFSPLLPPLLSVKYKNIHPYILKFQFTVYSTYRSTE